MPVTDLPEIDQLASPPPRPRRGVVLIVVAALVVAGAAVLATTSARARHSPVVRSPSSPPVVRAAASRSDVVFLEHLVDCTSTDHRRRVRVAFGVTNLGRRPLRLLDADPILSDARLQLRQVRFGSAPCAADGTTHRVRLGASGTVVVAFRFRIRSACPSRTLVAARVIFGTGDEVLHADSAELGGLNRLRFADC